MYVSAITAVLLSASLGQPGQLTVTNERLTYGHLGPVRESAKYLPGDMINLAFEVQNITFDKTGKAFYTTDLDLFDSSGAELLKQNPRKAVSPNYLGGNTLPCAANLGVPMESKPGVYKLVVTVVDEATKKSVKVEKKIEVLPKAFGLVQVGTSADREANFAVSPVGAMGDTMYLNFSVVGFKRDTKSKQPHLKAVMRVLDDKGQPVGAYTMTGEAKSDVPENLSVVPLQFGVTMNRIGRFTLEVTATDVLTGQKSTVTFPIRVVEP
jgi:hypothetical protein